MKRLAKVFLFTSLVSLFGCPKPDPSCGDGAVNQASEACDDGNTTDTDGCTNACVEAICGDTITQQGVEQCDDGNIIDGDACEADCTLPVCGNDIIDPGEGEECDDGDDNSNTTPNACREDCTDPSCSDNVIDAGETCDDGNTTAGDGCNATCQDEFCGDGVDNNGNAEGCDDGNTNDNDDCKNDCTPNVCGDGVVKTSGANQEGCDDGNNVDNDACRDTCVVATCRDGVVQAINGETCDDNNAIDNDACTNICQVARCDDGVTFNQGGGTEQCDDGDANNNDACTNACTIASCGDGITFNTEGGVEQCDDANAINTDACIIDATSNQLCELAVCGDGFVRANSAEECDDGNAVDGDFCETDCSLPECDNGIVDVGEVCFDDSTNLSLTVAVDATSINVADFDGDNDQDFVVTPSGQVNYSIFSNSGNGETYSIRTFNEQIFFGPMTVGDANIDGRPDLFSSVLNGNNGGIIVRINSTPAGGALAFVAPPVGIGGYPINAPQQTRVGDIDGNGFPDLVSSGDGSFFTRLGAGNGSFGSLGSFAVEGSVQNSLAVVDVDGDLIDDVIVAEFGTQKLTIIFFNSSGTPAATVSFQLGQRGLSLATGDFDNDGDVDVAVGGNNIGVPARVGVARNLGGRQFAAPLLFNTTDTGFQLEAGDVNHDGILDLLIEGDGGVRLALGNGDLSFDLDETLSTGAGAGRLVKFADFNGDGVSDIALGTFGGLVRIFFATP